MIRKARLRLKLKKQTLSSCKSKLFKKFFLFYINLFEKSNTAEENNFETEIVKPNIVLQNIKMYIHVSTKLFTFSSFMTVKF